MRNLVLPGESRVVDILKNQTKGFKVKGNDVIEYCDYALYNDENNFLFQPYKISKYEVANKNNAEINNLIKEVERLKKELQAKTNRVEELSIELQKLNNKIELLKRPHRTSLFLRKEKKRKKKR